MKIMVDIGHPAHVHYFRNLAEGLVRKGHSVLFTSRKKEQTIELLEHYGFKYFCMGQSYKTRIGKIFGLFHFSLRLFIVALKFKPDFYLNATVYSALVAWIMRKPHISFEDTFNFEQVRLYLPFTSVVLTGSYPHPLLGKKEIHYEGYQELTYLHPNRFSPDPGILSVLGVKPDDKYIIIRFVSWKASHDFGYKGMNNLEKNELVKGLKKWGKIFITSESELPNSLKPFQLKTPSHRIHDVLAFAHLYVGEGATMASECAMLGTPAIYINSQDVYTIQEQDEKYGLVQRFKKFEGVLESAIEILNSESPENVFQSRRQKMLSEKIDVTAFLLWFVESYPESATIMKTNPEYQKRFV